MCRMETPKTDDNYRLKAGHRCPEPVSQNSSGAHSDRLEHLNVYSQSSYKKTVETGRQIRKSRQGIRSEI